MSLKECKNVETNRYEVTVEVDGDTFEKAISKVYRKQVKSINVPGFRKGKAPRNIIEKMYGEGVFFEDAIEEVYPEALNSAIEEAKLKVIRDQVGLEIVEVSKSGLVFKATVTTYPEVEVGDYKKLTYLPKSVEVTDELINDEIDKVRDQNSRVIDASDRAARAGDIVVIDFEGFKDGIPFEGGKAENYNLTLGSGQFIPGFEEAILGHSVNEEFEINVTFPEDYQVEELAGAPVVFEIKLHEVKAKELPQLDDEFVKDVSDKETVEEYKEEIRGIVAERLEREAKLDKEQQICEKLIDLVVADIPQAMFKNRTDMILNDIANKLRSQGLNMETYLQYTGMTEDDIREQYKAQAEGDVKLNLALTKIAELENIEVSKEEVDAEYKKLAEMYKLEEDKIRTFIPQEEITEQMRLDLTMKQLLDSAKEAKSSAKKTTKRAASKKAAEKEEKSEE